MRMSRCRVPGDENVGGGGGGRFFHESIEWDGLKMQL